MPILAPCSTALQKLVNICYDYANEHDILYNAKKYVCMLINSKKFNVRSSPSIRVGSCTLGGFGGGGGGGGGGGVTQDSSVPIAGVRTVCLFVCLTLYSLFIL